MALSMLGAFSPLWWRVETVCTRRRFLQNIMTRNLLLSIFGCICWCLQPSSELAPDEEKAVVYGAQKASRRLAKKSGEEGLGPLTHDEAGSIHV